MMSDGPADASLAMIGLVGLLVLGGLLLLRWLKRRGPAGEEGAIRLVAVRSLGGKRMLALVEVEEERFLLGMTDERIACIGTIPPRAGAAVGRPVALAEAR